MQGQADTCWWEHSCPRLWQCQRGSGTLGPAAFLKAALPDHAFHTHTPWVVYLPPQKKAFVLSQCTFNVGSFHYPVIFFGIFIGKFGVTIFSSQLGKLRHREMR